MSRYAFIILFLLSVQISNAQNLSGVDSTIRSLEQLVVKGILEADTNILKSVWAVEFMVNTPHNNIAVDRDAVFQNQKAGLINYSSFERIIERMLIMEHTVITMGYETFVSKTDIPGVKAGQVIKRRFTNIWQNKNGKWLQIGRHASIICS